MTEHRSAEFSECGKHRFVLSRVWDQDKPVAMCIGLNPSTANSEDNDQTISRLTGSLRHLGFGGLNMTNLYTLISTDPKALHGHPDPAKGNDIWLPMVALNSQEIIFCWGGFKQAKHRAKKLVEMFPDAKCFGKTKDGSPWHPLAMMYAGMKIEDAVLSRFNSSRK